jgi:DNA primase catalytic subunit
MYVFSGGRGLHIWVCDKRARELKDSVRKSIVDYLELVTGNDKAASLLSEKVVSNVEDNRWWRGKLKDNASKE